ncbi:PolC-type DNA polymerase III [Mycoplasma mycoides]|uniref:PolC-type DNA polymerase III n=1 Tax=Mycoplasma mycoides TaxID=2102 RepID=UPI0022409AF2|nr:PolC-type DNA polymerase III [Mycoplasma mycoides]QVK09055.1 PolC-type DNA polymerase III [Mycoplasma mycoides subsp. capri]
MQTKILGIFKKIGIELDQTDYIYFKDAILVETPRISQIKNKGYLHIEIKDFLPIDILKKIEDKLKNNQYFNFKLIIDVKNQEFNKDLLIQYLEFIKMHKSLFNNRSSWKLLDIYSFELINNQLVFLVNSQTIKNEISLELDYCLAKLNQFGFKDLSYLINVNEISLDTLDTKQQINKTYDKPEYEKQIIKPIEKKPSINNSYKNKRPSLDKPSYNSLLDVEDDAQNIVIQGMVINKEFKLSKTGRKIFYIDITDFQSSIRCMYFAKSDALCEFDDLTEDELKSKEIQQIKENKIQINDWISVKGKTSLSIYDQEQIFYIDDFKKIKKQVDLRIDDAKIKRVELHAHTKMSVMDGVSDPIDYLELISSWNHKAIAFTDHTNVQAFPDIYKALSSVNKKRSDQDKIKAIYGLEMNMLNNDLWYVKNPKNQNLKDARMVFFDLETTGLSPELDEIIEFGAIEYNLKTGERKKIDILIKPKAKLKAFTQKLTNITEKMLEDKPSIEQAFKQINEIIKDAILVAHNANFDFTFLSYWSEKLGYGKLENTIIDTLTISRIIYPDLKSHRLGSLAKRVNISYDPSIAHRGDYDADILADIYERMLDETRKKIKIITDSDWNKIDPINYADNLNYYKNKGFHTNILVKNQAGLKELYKLVTKSHTTNFYAFPKIFKDDLIQIKQNNNLLFGASCVNSEIFELARTSTLENLKQAIGFYDYIEIQPISVYKNLLQNDSLDLDQLKQIITNIINIAKQENKLVVASSDCHYTNPELKQIREVYINAKGLGGIRHPLFDFNNRVKDYPDQHLRTTKEMLKEFEWLNDDDLINEIVITNSNKIADMIDSNVIPIKDGLFTPKIANVNEKLKDKCYQTAKQMYGEMLPEIVEKRLEKELGSITKHGFAIVYWISHLLVKQSLDDGYLVGSRGSVGSSFVATMAQITEVNPLKAHYRCLNCKYSDFNTDPTYKCGYDLPEKNCPNCNQKLIGDGHDIPFETFLGFDGDKVPDIDLNFSGEYQNQAHNFTKKMFGENNVFRAGTISTVAEKTAFGYVKTYFEETKKDASLPRKTEINRLAKLAQGVKRTTGQHPGGIIILPNEYEIEDFTPVNYPADDLSSTWKTTHFDFHSIHDNLLKMDILGHDDPTALKMLRDLTNIDPITIPTDDKNVYSLFSSLQALNLTSDKINDEITGAIGIPEFGTGFVRNMLKETQPKTFADLVQISGLSHGTDVWLGNARDLIKDKKADISTVIGCRDDIMVYLINMGLESSLAFMIMESVRKGKGLKKEWIDIMKQYNVPDWYIDSCLKIKYMFPKAHATAYVLMAYRIAWYKIYYPTEYYATYLTTRADVFDLKTALGGYDAVLLKLKSQQQRVKNGEKLSKKEEDLEVVYEVLLEMFARGIKFSNIDFEKSEATKFKVDILQDNSKIIIPPFNVIDSLGEAVALSIINARNTKPITSVNDLKNRTQTTQTQIKIFEEFNILDSLSVDEQLAFDF